MPLTKKQLGELKEDLIQERDRILNHLKKLKGAADEELAPPSGDSADIASMELSQRSIEKLGNRETKLLKKIDQALQKMEDGEYGICEYSGEEIPFARLKVRPFTQYTVEAKEELERRERGFRKGGGDSFDVDLDDTDD